jgi:hypothetical protein
VSAPTAEQVHERLIAFHRAAVALLGDWERLDDHLALARFDASYPFDEDFGEVTARIGTWRDAVAASQRPAQPPSPG